MYYLNCFFLYSIIGFLFEHIVCFTLGEKGQSGILYGPWTPVYGIGIILVIIVSNFILKNLHTSKILQTLVIFITVTVLLTFLELIGGIIIEKIFHTTLWDYSSMKFHIGKYIALEVSLFWGILSLILVYFIKPFMDKIIMHIPSYITYGLLVLFIIDLLMTIGLKTKIKDYFKFFG